MLVEATEKVIPKKSWPWKGIGIGISTFAVVILLATGMYIFFEFLKIYDQLIGSDLQSQQKIQHLQVELASLKNTAIQSQQNIDNFQLELNQFKQSVQALGSINKQNTLQVHFVYHLIKTANLRLTLDQNISAALDILTLADKDLMTIDTPQALNLRKAIATDILNLQQIASVDVVGIYLKLAAINTQIEQLPLMQPFNEKQATTHKKTTQVAQTWQESLDRTWNSLRELIVIRYHPSDKIPLLSPNQQIFIYENLHAYVLQAMWAVLHAEPAIYQANLKQIQTILKEYFLQDSPVTINMLNAVTELLNINIRPDIPKLTSLAALTSTDEVH